MNTRPLVSFDWAIKHLLRDKANFDILEGFLTALLRQELTILSLLESESNQEDRSDKFNCVDLLVENDQHELIIIEVQSNREIHYLERLLYGTSKLIVENLNLGDDYHQIKKVISVSILYFLLGEGENDYVFYGTTEFYGLNTHSHLKLKRHKKAAILGLEWITAKDLFPEYYLIEVEQFQDIIQTDLDEWIYLLKHSEVKPDFKAKHIQKAREKLAVMNMNPVERKAFERFMLNRMDERESIESAKEEGREEGREKGRDEEKFRMAQAMLAEKLDLALIAKITGLSIAEIQQLT
ncbi:hypothetical protein THII_3238 [Thioploca ingrica]|uniref:Rpn family recombination-promoting nuclease/putative transposase n=1 Tax=Thioploca ingrica TaxID=40754 RepID=A0A090APR7_9GAMM|nr:hypothetical protein THII_3238 [Thioploca ingrica]